MGRWSSRQRGARKWSDERFASDAPSIYSVEEARAWAAGYNAAAVAAARASVDGRARHDEEQAERERLGLDG